MRPDAPLPDRSPHYGNVTDDQLSADRPHRFGVRSGVVTGSLQSFSCSLLGRTAGDIGDIGPISSVFVLLLIISFVVIIEGKALIGDCVILIYYIGVTNYFESTEEIIGCESECTAFWNTLTCCKERIVDPNLEIMTQSRLIGFKGCAARQKTW